VYDIPEDIGTFDICTFGSVLLHLRDPFLALQRVSAHVQETVIVTDVASGLGLKTLAFKIIDIAEALTGIRMVRFLPDAKKLGPVHTWWALTPRLISEFLQILGFANTTISYHRQLFENREIQLFTVVGHRKAVRTS
jgi:hypothetical protein